MAETLRDVVLRGRRFGDRVAVEQPCFPPLLDLLEMAGVVPIGVGYDAQGPVVADAVAALDAGAKVLFFQPWGQNPSGQSMSRARAAELADKLQPRTVEVEDLPDGTAITGAHVTDSGLALDFSLDPKSTRKPAGDSQECPA